MRNIKTITFITLMLSVLVLLLSFLDYAASHDINKDYVSREVLTYLKITLSADLPDWTKTEGEWSIVTISLLIRFLFLIVNILVIGYYYRKLIPKINNA